LGALVRLLCVFSFVDLPVLWSGIGCFGKDKMALVTIDSRLLPRDYSTVTRISESYEYFLHCDGMKSAA